MVTSPRLFLIFALLSTYSAEARGARSGDTSWIRQYIAGLRQSQALPSLRSDRRIDRAARLNSRAVAEIDGELPTGAESYLRFQLQRHGVVDAVQHAWVVRFRPGAVGRARLRSSIERQVQGSWSHMGMGVHRRDKGEHIATIILTRRLVHVRRRGPRLCVRALRGHRPRLWFTTPSGRVVAGGGTNSRRLCRKLPNQGPGRYEVEVMVDGRFGPEVAALFPIYLGQPAPSAPVTRLYPPGERSPQRAESRLLALINAAREKAALAPLRMDQELAAAARAHSNDMRRMGFFGHRSPRWGSLAARLASRGIRVIEASENLALSSSARRAHDRLMASPAHRRVILDGSLSHVGIGVVVQEATGLLYITQCFTRHAEK
ncbi:MAG: CAP domain-containing protein [Deltaproteobacteria bacterium]|nr:CAP domain-containing protein [Deltaproteobacteria bacterium]